ERCPIFTNDTGAVSIQLLAIVSRTGQHAATHRSRFSTPPANLTGPTAFEQMLAGVDAVCIATPDDRHFEFAKRALEAGKHVLIEKPSVLDLHQLDELTGLAQTKGVLAKVVYHKLFDPDHMKLRTHVAQDVLRHVNNGYCSLLEPKRISRKQFAEWISGRNP